MDDHDLLVALRTAPATSELAERLSTRDLYKRAVWAELDAVPEAVVDADHDTVIGLEADIADRAGVSSASVVLDVPGRPSMTESTSRVMVSGEMRRLGKQSPLVSALRTAGEQQWRLGVYAPPDATDRVGRAAVDVLGLELDGALVSDVRPGVTATLDEFTGP
jgi:HD superfamily phosphohydrolase